MLLFILWVNSFYAQDSLKLSYKINQGSSKSADFSNFSQKNLSSDSSISIETKKQFEGVIHYQVKQINPNKMLISDEEFYRDMPNNGISSAKLYIKGNLYKWEFSDKIERFDPTTQKACIKLLQKDKDTFYCLPVGLPEDKPKKILKHNQTANVLGHNLISVQIISLFGTKTFYYHPNLYLVSPKNWANNFKDGWGSAISFTGAIPLKMESNGMLENVIYTAIKVENRALKETEFNF